MGDAFRSSAMGRDSVGEPGDSMRGVTGRESVFASSMPGASIVDPNSNFALPVDSEHKAKSIKLLSIAQPHMRAFHLSWFSFFMACFATFAATPLLPVIRDNIDLTKVDLNNAGVASVTGTIASRLLMGTVCDTVGPRFGHAFLMLLTAPAAFAMASVSTPAGFIITRMVIGLSMGVFVATQFWASVMFNGKIVGIACGCTAGWGNLGSGVTQFAMPIFLMLFEALGAVRFTAWRLVFFVPALLQIFAAFLILAFSQDLPDGQYSALKKSGEKVKDAGHRVLWVGLQNYRMWTLGAVYAVSMGVELTMQNVLSTYYYDRWNVDLTTAGFIASLFGCINLFGRATGGIISDFSGQRFGMRGRLWAVFVLMSALGGFMILFGRMSSLLWAVLVMLPFAFFTQAASGASFGIVPFISRRALGIVSGVVGASGNAGSAILQAVFFKDRFTTQDALSYVGIVVVCVSFLTALIHFPQWGSMFFGPSRFGKASTEEEYYAGEYSVHEQSRHMHETALKFAANARSERGKGWDATVQSVVSTPAALSPPRGAAGGNRRPSSPKPQEERPLGLPEDSVSLDVVKENVAEQRVHGTSRPGTSRGGERASSPVSSRSTSTEMTEVMARVPQ